MTSYTWTMRAGLAASYTLASDWTGGNSVPGPGDSALIGGGGIATDSGQISVGMSMRQTGAVSLTGAGTSLTAAGMGVGIFGVGALAVTAGATLLTTGSGGVDAIGYEGGGVGTATIDGIGSLWTSEAAFVNVGYQGSAALTVSNGGALSSAGYLAVSAAPGGAGSVTLTGAGSVITAQQGLTVDGGGGTLSVAAGGVLTTSGATDSIGDLSGGGAVSVGGSGATWWQNAQTLVVGDPGGASALDVGAGGYVLVGGSLQVGNTAMSGGIDVTGGGQLWLTAASQNIGFLVTIGGQAGSAGTIEVSGGSHFTTNGNPLLLGGLGSGTLSVGAGGFVAVGVSTDTPVDAAEALCLGEYAGSVGVLTVSGAGAQMIVSGGGFAGSGGTAQIVVSNGGSLVVGDAAGTAGGFGLSIGAGAPAPQTTQVIDGGNATATIASGGTLLELNGFSVGLRQSTGSVSITGGLLEFVGQMAVGNGDSIVSEGWGSVVVGAAGTLLALGQTVADNLTAADLPALCIGAGSYGGTGAGTLTVSGAGALVNAGGYGIAVGGTAASDPTGGGGTGILIVSGAGSVTCGAGSGGSALAVGVATASVGAVAVSGAGSEIVAAGEVAVGVAGDGGLSVSNGGMLVASQLDVATQSGGIGTLIAGAGGTLAISGNVSVGLGGTGTLSIAPSAAIAVGGVIIGAGGSLLLDHSVGAGQAVYFAAASGLLQIGDPAAFAGVIVGFQAGDTLQVTGMSGAGVTIGTVGGDTVLSFSTGATIALAGAYGVNTAGFPALLGMLEAEVRKGVISTITLAASGVSTLALSPATIMADPDALRAIASPYVLDLSSMTGRWIGTTIQSADLGGGGLQEVAFGDGAITMQAASPAAEIERLYLTAFGVNGTPAGIYFWSQLIQDGAPLSTIAADFVESPEFALYGSLSDAQFITLLYQNALGRAPGTYGLSAWEAVLASGVSRAEVMLLISDSPEHLIDTAATTNSGLWELNPSAACVELLYQAAFGGLPTVAGLTFWTGLLTSGALTLTQVAQDFVASPQFQMDYGGASNTAIVTDLYANALHRTPDAAGLAEWDALLAGGMSWGTLLYSIANSPEAQLDDTDNIIDPSAAQQGVLALGPVTASGAVIGAGLDALQAQVSAGAVTAISLTDGSTASVPITVAQLATDAGALAFISGSYYLDVGAATVETSGTAVQADNLGNTTGAAYVQFADGRLVFNTADPAAEIYRLYQTALGRLADQGGEDAWTAVLQGGVSLLAVAQSFLNSAEYAADFGAPSNDMFITDLFQNALSRAPGPSGLAGWDAVLAAGVSRAQVLVDISESPEHVSDTAAAIHAGIWNL